MKIITLETVKSHCVPDTVNGCWIWFGWKFKDGYGRWHAAIRQFGTPIAHRVAYFLANGTLPTWPMVLDHICKNKGCVNPDHLRVRHHVDNAFDGNMNPEKCPRGHSRWRARPGGHGRECLDCRNIFKRRYRERKKAGLVKARA